MGIVNFINKWLKDIVILFIFISIVELISPKGSMKKYINMVFGFLIIIVIINPFIKLVSGSYNFDRNLYNHQVINMEYNIEEDPDLLQTQKEQIKELYVGKVKKELIDLINKHSLYKVEDINLVLNEKKEEFGELVEVEIFLGDYDKNTGSKTIEVEAIKKVDINQNTYNETKEDSIQYTPLEDNRLIEAISSQYNIDKDRIKLLINKGVGELGEET